jgi:hypothetical protein
VRIINETNAMIATARKWSEEMPHRGAQTEPMIASWKCLGDHADTPPAKRQKDAHSMEPIGYTKVVVVRLYMSRLDWDHICEAQVNCNNDGGLDLEEVMEQLGFKGSVA